MTDSGPTVFGVRHLSPAASNDLLRTLDAVRPTHVLVEGPSDADGFIPFIVSPKSRPPLALLAYTASSPVRSLLYPFAGYSPEYVALRWAAENGAKASFMDLPAAAFLAMDEETVLGSFDRERLAASQGYADYDDWWEHGFESNLNPDAFRLSAFALGEGIRRSETESGGISSHSLQREKAMRKKIAATIASGADPLKVVVVCGAFHAPALATGVEGPEDDESPPLAETRLAIMPYSYYRLSSRSGYGAGNRAPAYYAMLWDAARGMLPAGVPTAYLSGLASAMRAEGNHRSSADVIESVRLAMTLAALRGASAPSLADLKDAAVTILGRGEEIQLAKAFARLDIGTEIGMVPPGSGLTATQEDFHRQLSELKLGQYLKSEASVLELDLRENRRVKSEDAAFLDLGRSCFLRRLSAIGVAFGELTPPRQGSPTWQEAWKLRWTPETEVALAEGSLLGDTVELAAAYALAERLKAGANVAACAAVADLACQCGLESSLSGAIISAQAASSGGASFAELADACWSLAQVIEAAALRRIDSAGAAPLVAEFFLGAALRFREAASCDDAAARVLSRKVASLDFLALSWWKDLDGEEWTKALGLVASRDDLSPYLSGYSLAILLERPQESGSRAPDDETISSELSRRLSPGTPSDLGASWFEGFSARNRAALLSRLPVWKALDGYLSDLDEEAFRRALVSLRRAFAPFSPAEKRMAAENLGSLWGLDAETAENALRSTLGEEEKAKIEGLKDFDFDDV